jgi:Gpi18-like mannosyltransferase
MNGALWGQCDTMFTTGFLASLFYLLEGRPLAALIAFGLAASLKPQAIFWCPLLAGLVVAKRLKWQWLWVPAALYVLCGVPQMLAGRPAMHVLLHWARASNVPGLTLGATNWYQWVFEQQPEIFSMAGMALALTATALFVLWMHDTVPGDLGERGVDHGKRTRYGSAGGWLVSFALLSVMFPPFLLPGMHERYFFAADVLSIIYAFYVPRGWVVTVLVQFASAFTYLPYLFAKEPVPRWFLALVMLAAIGLLVNSLIGSTVSQAEGDAAE